MNEIETAADLTAFEAPAEWFPMKYPRRDGFPPSVRELDPHPQSTVDERLRAQGTWVTWELEQAPDVNEYVLAARRQRQGDASPLGAAALFTLLTRRWYGPDSETTQFADLWVSELGLAGAVEAMLESSDLRYQHRERARPGPSAGWTATADVYVMYYDDGSPDEAKEPEGYASPGEIIRDERLETQFFDGPRAHVSTRLRELLVIADAAEYEAARSAAQRLRTNAVRAMTATFLFPTERDWADDVFLGETAPTWHWRMQALASVSSPKHLDAILTAQASPHWVSDSDLLAAIVDGIGVEVAGALANAFDSPGGYGVDEQSAVRSKILDVLVGIPTDNAFRAILERVDVKGVRPVLLDAMARYPRRAFRLLAQKNWSLFDRHARAYPDVAIEIAPELSPSAIARLGSLGAEIPLADDLPPLMVTPPWVGAKKRPAPVVITGVVAPTISKVVWLPGELEELKARPHDYSYTTWDLQKQYVKDPSPHIVNEWQAMTIFLLAPDETARPLLTEWRGTELDDPQRVVQRFELEALPLMLQLSRAHPGAAAPYLLPFVDIAVARLQATALATRKTLRIAASEWLIRNADDAIALLAPDAVGSPGQLRDHAVVALRAVGRRCGNDHVCSIAEQYGSDVVAVLRAMLEQDPLEILPAKIPRVGAWADLDSLPPVLTADRSARLPSSAIGHLLTMCAISKPDYPYPGLAVATTVCDRSSLAAAAWELFERWWGEGAPSKDNWIVLAQGFLGDDSTVAALVPLIRRWPGESGTARAQSGLDALSAIGSSRSLTELHDMSRRMKFKSLKNGAAQRVTEVAESLGLDQDQLGDRIVPDLELPVLDYGGRTFTIEFTETLVPYVIDEKGKKAKSLPKPSAGDDPAMAEAARTQFTAFKREVKAVATEQIKRLNRAMVTGRRWSADEFSQYLLGHPLMVHLVRRLLWASWGEDGSPAVVFRVAEGNTCADVDDRTIARPDEMIGLVHPAHIPESISAWSEVFADHEILQPFPQLGRPVHDPKPEDLDGSGLDRFTGVTATPSQALRLTYRGWEPVWENPASWGQGLLYRLGDSVSVLLGLEPGMGTGSPYDGYPDQTLVSVEVRGGTLADVDRATVSELLADLEDFAS